MRGAINKKEAKRLVKEQQETERVQKERRKAFESFQSKPNCEVEGEKKKGILLLTLKGGGKVIFTEMDKFERWVKRRDFHWAK